MKNTSLFFLSIGCCPDASRGENADAKLTEVRMRRATESQREAVHFDRRVPISWPCCLWPPWAAVRQPVQGRWDVPEGQSRAPFQAKLQHTLPMFAPSS